MIRWLFSKSVREACAVHKHYRRLLAAQRDTMSPQAIGPVQAALSELHAAISEGANKGKLRIKSEELQFAAEKWIKSYPHPAWRENVEVLLVALAVAMGIRTFFLQPFKIPTGSMQPTLFGVTSKNLIADKTFQMPTGWERVKEWFAGISYVDVVAQTDGSIDAISPMTKFLIFNIKQTLFINGVAHTMWFPPDYGEAPQGMDAMAYRAQLQRDHVYHKGDQVVKLKVSAGDHLFVDRLTYNFRKPERGEIVVFETAGIPQERRDQFGIPGDQFYIKRLVGLSDEMISLKQDYDVTGVPQFGNLVNVPVGHLIANGQPLSASTPRFENVYSFSGAHAGTNALPFQENHYYGHALVQGLAPEREFQIQPNHLFVMGDNTMNSLDSRYWGDFPASSVIGKSCFVYWPITKRFGLTGQ